MKKRFPPVSHAKIREVLSLHGLLVDIKNISTLHPLSKDQIKALHEKIDQLVTSLSEQTSFQDDLSVLKGFKRHIKKILSGQSRPNFV